MKPECPKTRIRPFEETLHGRKMIDNYRWLETDGEERTTWIDRQNELVDKLVLDDPRREMFSKRFDELFNYDRTGFPAPTLSHLFYLKIKSGEKHASLYMRSWPDGEEQILMDIDEFSELGNISFGRYCPTRDSKLLAYSLSKDGSDWLHWYVMDLQSGDIIDEIPRLVYTWICWLPDNSGFIYSRSTDPDNLSKNGLSVFLHKLGTDWRNDKMILGKGLVETDIANAVAISRDGTHLIIEVNHGLTLNELFYTDLSADKLTAKSITGDHTGLFYANIYKGMLYVRTSNEAPNHRVCRVVLDGSVPLIDKWETIVPEGDDALTGLNVIGDRFFIKQSVDVITHTFIYSLDGKRTGELEYPGVGNGSLPYGEEDVDAIFVSYSSPFQPAKTYHYDIQQNKLTGFTESSLKVSTEKYLTEQVFFKSLDNTVVPMFIIRNRDIELDGSNSVILTGYGGFNASRLPYFSSAVLFWLEQGGIYAIANIRGGGEYGENWHQGGMLGNKQNVFNDFIAAGEALIGEKPVRLAGDDNFSVRRYSSREHLGISGGSNGGLLTGAVLVQRPDLWAAVVSDVPLLDMLRFHLTQGGKFWMSEYGSPDNPEDFEWLVSYSPYHNVKEGSHFPPTLLKTSLHDDRGTDSLHAFKMAAKLQAVNTSDNPILLRTMTNVGHGAGRTTQMNIDEQTEIFLFLVKHLM
ncbi:MAG: prolyl oligopeptidase family serine peptidase [Candidatus Sabulitectum sp.]|nr:prolyl oligopeptidase family serine peptidase [Candidatus Sabulitectum sp.]